MFEGTGVITSTYLAVPLLYISRVSQLLSDRRVCGPGNEVVVNVSRFSQRTTLLVVAYGFCLQWTASGGDGRTAICHPTLLNDGIANIAFKTRC